MSLIVQPDRERVDAREKVLGRPIYAADVPFEGMLFAMTTPARIAKGRVVSLTTDKAKAVPGVVRILDERDFPPLPQPSSKGAETKRPAPAAKTITDEIGYRGQPIALVVADTLEAAIEAAALVDASYATTPFVATLDQEGGKRDPVEDTKAGDAETALANAASTVDETYISPAQHHNPIEMLSTTAVWHDGKLTVWEGSQNTGGIGAGIAAALQIDPSRVVVKSQSAGGGFGQKAGPQIQSALVSRAAMLTGRPVKMVVPRAQIFHTTVFRPESRHHVRLGSDAVGRMTGVRYDAEQQNSPDGKFPPEYHNSVSRLYGIDNYLGTAADVRIDTQAPGFMRAPHQHPPCFAFESAVDELAYRTDRDPVAFRLANGTDRDPIKSQPLSSRFLDECIERGAARFDWSRRTPKPGSMRLPDGTLVGLGMACGADPVSVTPAVARLRITPDGGTRLVMTGHEMGQGIRTAITAALLDQFEFDVAKLDLVIGDTGAALQHTTAGSWGTASTVPVVRAAARKLLAELDALPGADGTNGTVHQRLGRSKRPFVEVAAEHAGPGQRPQVFETLKQGGLAVTGPVYDGFTTMSYSAHFVELHVEPRTRRIRMPRSVTFVDCGRVISPRTAESQVRGGVVWAFGGALREASEVDPRYGGCLNADLADYVVPVNADIGMIEVGFIDRPDPRINDTGIKCLGEVVMAGAGAAIANAVFHATGRRIRHMPIRVEDLL